jgi:hypothetical protein
MSMVNLEELNKVESIVGIYMNPPLENDIFMYIYK